jgi:hypothetical protein
MDPENAQQEEREVQLEGERLEQARRHVTLAQDHLKSLADIVLTTIGLEHVAEGAGTIRLSINVDNDPSGPRECIPVVFADMDTGQTYTGSYRDPPGICTSRPC